MSPQNLRILLVDSHIDERVLLQSALEEESWSVHAFSTFGEVVEQLEERQMQYDVALIDNWLIWQNDDELQRLGLRLADFVRRRCPEIQLIVFTEQATSACLEALQAGVHDTVRRPFHPEEILLKVRRAVEHIQMKEVVREKQILEQLMATTLAITSNLDQETLLHTIIEQATTLITARSGSIFLNNLQENELTVIASYERPAGIDRTLKIGEGLAGRLAQGHDSYMIVNDYQLWEGKAHRYADNSPFGAMIGVPLKWQDRIIGVLCVDDVAGRIFTKPEAKLLRAFADHAAIAINNAQLVTQLNGQKYLLNHLIASSPNAIIANDQAGFITHFNEQAAEILEYQPEEALGKYVTQIYADEQDAFEVGQALHHANGLPIKEERLLYSQSKERIPVRLTATKLYNDFGDALGNVGYFEDLRTIRKTEQRLELLLKVNNIVANESGLETALQNLAETLVTYVDTTFCRIFILDENQDVLIVKAASIARKGKQIKWDSAIESSTALTEWQELEEFVKAAEPTVLRSDDEARRPFLTNLSEQLHLGDPIQSLFLIPLKTNDRLVGLLGLGELREWERAPFTAKKQELAAAIADQTAILIERKRLHEQSDREREQLHSLYTASNKLVWSQRPDKMLREIVEQARVAAGATWVHLLLVDGMGPTDGLVRAGKEWTELLREIRPNGLSEQVMLSGQPYVIEDTDAQKSLVNPVLLENAVVSSLCLPLSLRGKPIGVVWVDYDHPHRFSRPEIEALQLYVNQAAISYDNARSIQELKHMRQAAEALASVADLQAVLKQIVESACTVMKADSAFIWSYDQFSDSFLPDESTASNVSDQTWLQFCKSGPREDGTAHAIIESKWLPVNNVNDIEEYSFLGGSTRRLLSHIDAQSFQGIALSVENETLGILYVNYNYPRTFNQEERETAQTFANHAALALKKAHLLEQVRKARDAARVVAKVTALDDDLRKTLCSVAKGTQDVLKCDAITIYAYNPDKNEIESPPYTKGLNYPEKVTESSPIHPSSIIYRMLQQEHPYFVDHMAKDPLFKSTRFIKEEGICSCIAIPLKAHNERVGVMFVNYRTPYQFTGDEMVNIELFANQAAVAISNVQLYEDTQKKADILRSLHLASTTINGSLDIHKSLSQIASQAAHLTRSKDNISNFATILLFEDMKVTLAESCPKETPIQIPLIFREGIAEADRAEKQIGIIGRTLKTGQSQVIGDVTQDKDYIDGYASVRSELTVPILMNSRVIGVIDVQHHGYQAFNERDVYALESLAILASTAIHNAQQYEELQRFNKQQEALYSACKVISTDLFGEQKQVLENILEQAVERFKPANAVKASMGCIQLYDEETNELWVKSFYPPTISQNILVRIGEKRKLDRSQNRIGISGRSVLERQPLCIDDVRIDPDYRPFDTETHSEIDIPLISEEKVWGVLTLESDQISAFDKEDEYALKALAELAMIAIQNMEQYRELERTKGLVGARTSLAWMGMVSNVWRHTIEGHAINIIDELNALQERLPQKLLTEETVGRLNLLKSMARDIMEKPITPPLSSEEGVRSIAVNALFSERLRQLRYRDEYRGISFRFDPELSDRIVVRVSYEWLRRAFDILMDNAVASVSSTPVKQVHIKTYQEDSKAVIEISDTGYEIPKEICEKLFCKPIEKEQGDKGLGMGSLMAQTIVQTYGGEIRLESTGPNGTTIAIWLPVER